MSKKLRFVLLPMLIMALLLTAVSFATAEKNSVQATEAKASKLKITTQPKNQDNILVGKNAKFTVKASGKGLKYQWYYKEASSSEFTKWKKMTKATLSFKTTKNQNGMKVYCEVTDSSGKTVKSKEATLTIFQITEQPEHVRDATPDQTVTFTVGATGKGLKYQWYIKKSGEKSFSKWKGKTKSALSFKPTVDLGEMKLYCEVTSSGKQKLKTKEVELLYPNDLAENGLCYSMLASRDGMMLCCFEDGKEKETLSIPATVRGFAVKEVQPGGFQNNLTLKHVLFPDENLWNIGYNAFEDCFNLESVRIGASVYNIQDRAFSGCTKLQVNLPDTVHVIGFSAFDKVTAYIKVNAGTSAYEAALNTKQHYEVNYGSYTLWLDEQIITKEAVSTTCPTEITIPNMTDWMSDVGLFAGWTGLQTVNFQPEDDFYNVGASAFKGCTGLTTVNFAGRGMHHINASAFEGCTALKNIALPNGLLDIGSMAFKNCTALTELTIPESVNTIGDGAFDGCTVKLHIYRNSPADEWVQGSGYTNYDYVN